MQRARAAASRAPPLRKLACTSKIRAAFPSLQFQDAALIDTGVDHAVLILDESWVFRFPRESYYAGLLHAEAELLRALSAKTTVSVPEYVFLNEPEVFGGYRLIPGRGLSPALFGSLEPRRQREILRKLAQFLAAMHALPASLVTAPHSTPRDFSSDRRFSDGCFSERRETLARALDAQTLLAAERFYPAAAGRRAPADCVVHGDFTEKHILLAPDGDGLGIIDFSDAALGDPAWDFAALWCFGDWVVPYMLEHYVGQDDPDLLERSRWHAVRYWLNQLYWRLRIHDELRPASQVASIVTASLDRLDLSDGALKSTSR